MAKSTLTLYERLKFVEAVGGIADSIRREAQSIATEKWAGLMSDPRRITEINSFEEIKSGNTPHIAVSFPKIEQGTLTEAPTLYTIDDITRVQRSIMIEYAGNPVFQDAASGRVPVEETFERLNRINKGIRVYLPKRVNPRHNEAVGYLSELIECPSKLETRGIITRPSVQHNFSLCLTGGGSASLIMYCFAIKYQQQLDNLFQNCSAAVGIPFMIVGGIATLMGLTMIPDSYRRNGRESKNAAGQAKYLDKMINGMYSK